MPEHFAGFAEKAVAPSEVLLDVAPSEVLQGQRWVAAVGLNVGAFAKVAPSEDAEVAPSEDAQRSLEQELALLEPTWQGLNL